MDLELSADQVALRDGIASLLDGRFPMTRVRQGFDRAMFEELRDAGVFSLRRDGFSWADCVVVLEQLGRACVPGPLVPSLLLGDGRVAGAGEPGPGWVEHLDALDVLVVERPAGLAAVDPRRLDAEPSPWPLDPLTPVARVAELPPGEPLGLDRREWRRPGAALTAAFQVGLADRLMEIAVAHAAERVQFGRPIGSFQAIKHLCADMCARVEVARAAVYAAGAHLDETPPDVAPDRPVSVAKALAGDAALANGKAATQVHGGMGFTWEADVHLYLKRAWVLDTHFGTADAHYDAVAASLT